MSDTFGDGSSGRGVTEHQASTVGGEAYCPTCNRSFLPGTQRCPDDGAKLVVIRVRVDPMIGRTLDDRFEIRDVLGSGGMGMVYRGCQLSVDREVAIKVIQGDLANEPTTVKRFLREARLASKLNAPTIVGVHDFGQTDDGVLYLVMEMVRGRTLARELEVDRAFPAHRAVTIAIQLADALEVAHAAGIVHRDLKPGNVMIVNEPSGRDSIKVLDFGIAKSVHADSITNITAVHTMTGTPLYMAPEQIEGIVDPRSDLYSLGCILHEMLTGAPPFVDTSLSAVISRQLTEAPPRLPPTLPPALVELASRLLAKSPDSRIQSAAEVRAGLQLAQFQLASGAATERPSSAELPQPSAVTARPEHAVSSPAIAAPAGRRPLLIACIAVILVASGIAAYVLTRQSSSAVPAIEPDAARLIDGEVLMSVDANTTATASTPIVPVDASVPIDAREPIDARALVEASVDAGLPRAPRDAGSPRDARPRVSPQRDAGSPKPDAGTLPFIK